MTTTRKREKGELTAWLFSVPTAFLMLATLLLPIVVVIGLGFTNYVLGDPEFSFVGLQNYVTMFSDTAFLGVLGRTLLYVLIVVPLAVGSGLLLAILAQNVIRGKKLYQCLFFLPVTSTLVAMATVWKYLLHGNIGPVNYFLQWLGFAPIEFFGDPSWVLFSLGIIGIWQLAGFNMILFLAGLTAIPQELNEAATVDGADAQIDRFLTVTLPMLGPTMLFVIVTTSISAFKVFDTVAVLTHGGPQSASNVLLYQIYLEGFQYLKTGSASAMTVVFLMMILALSWVQTRIVEKKVHYQ